jgi:hypothetical protein
MKMVQQQQQQQHASKQASFEKTVANSRANG